MKCTTVTGLVKNVTSLEQCGRGGYIRIYSTYDNSRAGSIEIDDMELKIKQHGSLQQALQECSQDILCNIVLGAAETYILGKFKAGWNWLKQLLK